LAATDGHAKNFSLFHEAGGTYRMTPYYDVLSAWPIMGHGPSQLAWQKTELAMAVRSKNAHWKLKEILPRHWKAVAREAGLVDAAGLIDEVLAQGPAVLANVGAALPQGFPRHISEKIFAGVEQQMKALAAG